MVKDLDRPTGSPYMRSSRAQMLWKVPIHSPDALPWSNVSARSRISPAALLVKVTARMPYGDTPRSMRLAMR